MPCDYKNYPQTWKTVIRPDILERDRHCCKFCGIENYTVFIIDDGSRIYLKKYKGSSGFYICPDGIARMIGKTGKYHLKKIVLTIMHLDHNTLNNDYSNLAAGCQKCHLNYDKDYHKKNSRETNNKKRNLQSLFK